MAKNIKQPAPVQSTTAEIKADETAKLNSYEIGMSILQAGQMKEAELMTVEAPDEDTAFSLANAAKAKKHKADIDGNGAQVVYNGYFKIIKK
jgi:hypothetical protein